MSLHEDIPAAVSNRNSKSYMIRAYQLPHPPTLPFPHRAAALSLPQIEVFISTKTKSRFVNRDHRFRKLWRARCEIVITVRGIHAPLRSPPTVKSASCSCGRTLQIASSLHVSFLSMKVINLSGNQIKHDVLEFPVKERISCVNGLLGR